MRYRLKHPADISAVEFLKQNGLSCLPTAGDDRAEINSAAHFSQLDDNISGSVTFCHIKKKEHTEQAIERLENSQASLVLVSEELREANPNAGQMFVFVDRPMVRFAHLLRDSCEEVIPEFKSAEDFPDDSYIGPSVFVEKDVKTGSNVRIEGNTYIYSGTSIGNNVVIKPNVVIGGEGFQSSYDEERNELIHWPHLAGVVIGDDVRIGSSCCIDRGLFRETIISRGCSIDNLVHIAHGTVIGAHSLIVANSMIAGCDIGTRVWVAPSSSILPGVKIGDRAYIGMASCVIRDVPESTLVYGVPAKEQK